MFLSKTDMPKDKIFMEILNLKLIKLKYNNNN